MSLLASVGAKHEGVIEMAKASPPVTVVGLTLGGVTLQDWVYIVTLLYLFMQISWFLYSKCLRKAPASAID